MNKKENSDIYFKPSPKPKGIDKYLQYVMIHSIYGRDWEFCSPDMQIALDKFSWETRGLNKPDLPTFCRWAMNICKQGLGTGKRKKKKLYTIDKDLEIRIIRYAESYVDKIQDSFLGSPRFFDIVDIFKSFLPDELSNGLETCTIAQTLIKKRKKTPSTISCYIYAYIPHPTKDPFCVKLGYTTSDPYKRMDKATKNTRTELPQMLGYFQGTKADEKKILSKFKKYNIQGSGNKEMFKDLDFYELIRYLNKNIKEHGGKINEKYRKYLINKDGISKDILIFR